MRRVLAFYKFIPVTEPEARVEELQQLGEQLGVVGTILLAQEGVNGTIVAEIDSLDAMVRALEQAFGAIVLKCASSRKLSALVLPVWICKKPVST
jgi:predicted sulfurtransferase